MFQKNETDTLKEVIAKQKKTDRKLQKVIDKRVETYYDNLRANNTPCLNGTIIGTSLMVGLATSFTGIMLLRKTIIANFLSKPENSQILESLQNQIGLLDVNDIATFLTGKDGFAKVLYANSGVGDAVADAALTTCTLTAVGILGITIVAPLAYNYSKKLKYKINEKNYYKLNKELHELKEKRKILEKQENTNIKTEDYSQIK